MGREVVTGEAEGRFGTALDGLEALLGLEEVAPDNQTVMLEVIRMLGDEVKAGVRDGTTAALRKFRDDGGQLKGWDASLIVEMVVGEVGRKLGL